MRHLFTGTLIPILFIYIITGCKQQTSSEKKRHNLKLSEKADSLLSDTTRIDKRTDSLKKSFYLATNDTLAIDILNQLFEKFPRSLKIMQNEAYEQSLKSNYRYGTIFAEMNGALLAQSMRKSDSAQKLLDSILIKSRKYGYKYIEAKTLGNIGNIKLLNQDFKTAEELLKASLEVSEKNGFHDQSATALNKLGQSCLMQYKYKEALEYFDKGLEEAKLAKEYKLVAISYGTMGEVYRMQSDFDKAIENYLKSLPFAEKSEAYNIIISCLGYSAECYVALGNYVKAIEMNQQALAIATKYNLKGHIVSQLNRIGVLYHAMKQDDKAEALFERSIKLNDSLEIHDKHDDIKCYENLSSIYLLKKDFSKAGSYISKGLELCEQINDKFGIAYLNSMLGNIHLENKDYGKALEAYLKGLQIAKEVNAVTQISGLNSGIATVYQQMGQGNKSKPYALEAYKLASATKGVDNMERAAEAMYRMHEMEGNYREAFKMFKLYKQYNDSLISDATFKRFAAKDYEGKESSLKEEQATKDKLYKTEKEKKDLEIKQQKTVQSALITGGLILLLLAGIIFRSLQENKKKNKIITEQKKQVELQKAEVENQKLLIEEHQKETIDSITYAKRIQYALLGNEELLNINLPEHFVFFKPKDIVSGDFYWATEHENKFYLAVCDSTGHGVPGAFMSLLNMGFLSEAIKEKNISRPNEILNYVRKRLIDSIGKDEQKDGMDAILLCIESPSPLERDGRVRLTYSAANNEPILITKSNIIELSKDKMPVGKGEKTDSFTLFDIDAQTGDTLYLYTDGYADQFGGEKGKKFKYRTLNELLAKISKEEMPVQLRTLVQSFNDWKGALEQVDDVLIIGIKI